jgi:anti-sigma factor RsiW
MTKTYDDRAPMPDVDDAMLVAHADGQLPPQGALLVERTVARDPAAADRLRLMRESGEAVRDAFADAFTDPVPDGIAALLASAAPSGHRSRAWRRRLWLPALAASAAALLLGILVGRWTPEAPEVLTLASGPSSGSPLDDATALALVMALEGRPASGAGPRVTVLGDVDAGLDVPCRRFAIDASVPVHGIACRAADGSWNLLTLPGPAA